MESDQEKVSRTNAPQSHPASTDSFKFSDLELKLANPSQRKPKPDVNNLQFGKHFSDHMLEIEWTSEKGWEKPVILPVHNLMLHPAVKVLHYAIEVFEGMKAYRGMDGKIRIFRGEKNMERMLHSAARLALPSFDGGELLQCIRQLVSIDQEWVPHSKFSSLYIRPALIGTEVSLRVSKSNKAKLFVIMGPTGSYFSTGMKPVSLLADPQFVRSSKGCGDRKIGSNYAPTIKAQQIAEGKGLQQVLFLDGDNEELREVGTMNIILFIINDDSEKELITPPLDGTIIPGITRLSLLELAREWNEFKVTERTITMKEIIKLSQQHRLLEMFGCGTACLVCPVSSIYYLGDHISIPTMDQSESINQRFLHALTDIQYGRHPHRWTIVIN